MPTLQWTRHAIGAPLRAGTLQPLTKPDLRECRLTASSSGCWYCSRSRLQNCRESGLRLEVQQTGHQANGQFGASSVTTTSTHHRLGSAKQVLTLEHLSDAALMFELLRYCRLNLAPRQPRGQYHQRIAQIDHGVNSAAEKVHWLYLQIPQKVTLNITFFGGFGAPKLRKKLAFMRVSGVFHGRLLM
jgi:hypothetical protein